MPRTDIHRPSVIQPTDYQFVEFEYLGPDCWEGQLARREWIRKHMEKTGGTYSHHAHGGNCHICGAHCIYTALFHHKPSNVYIRTGLDCAEKLDNLDTARFRKEAHAALEQVAGKRKAEAVLNLEGLGRAWELFTATTTEGWQRQEGTVVDIVGKLVKYGSISPAQVKFLHSLLDQIGRRAEIEAARKIAHQAADCVPVTDSRITVKGKVLSMREPSMSDCYPQWKLLVQHESGWKVWGSRPASLNDVQVGDTVEFDATIKVSDRDPKFGFFSRPSKARKMMP